ncbi:adenylate kinase 7 isoform X6 [Heterocephalus glaber]|uniref:Adenylate kinase 7 isoform X6 n=1 Tax=Heterocephalus glaber TaxID=10181 RepID=A0AAX6RWQ1_HETGA|nr:adenylate kinase 7 isoform X6 [Heterocephalus glaber]
MAEKEEVAARTEKVLRSQRVFINLLDTYSSGNIGKFLASSVVGASLEEVTEEEEDEDENKPTAPETLSAKQKEGTFQIVGTLSKPKSIQPDFATEMYKNISRADLLLRLLECDTIIYNITESPKQAEEAMWAVSALNEEVSHFGKRKVFILVSTVMTWARSKPLDPDDSEVPFTEEDYRRRKNHPNFLDHINAEKTVLKFGKNTKMFATYVVAAGLQYGMEGGILHTFFKLAWLGDIPELPVFGDGTNVIPTIHVLDLAGVIQNIIDHVPKHRYLVAVDESAHTLEDLIKFISRSTGPGKIQKVPRENAFLIKELTQENVDHLLVSLRMEALFVKENFNIRWVARSGFVENVNNILKEYKQSRGLLPIKICILGPPAVGKSSIAEELSKYYKLHHIKMKDVIAEAIAKLEAIVAPKDRGEEDEGDEEEEEENVEDAQELLDGIKESMEKNAGELEDQYIIRFVKEKLKSMPCRNQGYILDGFPKTYDQAKDLFNQEDEEEEDEIRGKIFPVDKLILPDVGKLEDAQNRLAIKQLIREIGEPRNYGLTEEEKAELEQKAAEMHLAKEAAEEAAREQKEAAETAERMARWEEWNKQLEEVKREERELLEVQSAPLRNYLMTHVMPTLVQGLNECCKVRPDDPVDFLAEYLFKNNPETQ